MGYPSSDNRASEDLVKALTLSEKRYKQFVDAVTDYAIFLLDPRGVISSWNRGAARLSGYSSNEAIGKHFTCFYPQSSIDSGWPEHELRVARAEGRFEDEGWRLRKDGTRYWASVIITALYDEGGEVWGFSKITRDLSERRAHEDALRRSEERFRLLVEGVKDCAIFTLTAEGRISSWNTGAAHIKGYRADEIIGKHFSVFYPAEEIERQWPEYELEMARATGSFEDEGWRIRKNGTRFWANVLITALYDNEGKFYGFSKVTRDLTVRRRMQSLELAEQRMKEFLALLSHELRNPLAPIRSALSAMDAAPEGGTVHKRARAVINRQVSHMARLVDDLLDISRVTTGTVNLLRVPIDLQEVVKRAVESSLPWLEQHRHQLHQDVPDEPLIVDGDLVRLTQVLVNLLNNAARYTREGGQIRLRLSALDGHALIRVNDNGIGIDPSELESLFGLFAQGDNAVDRHQAGLGVGLALARQLVELHGGILKAYSEGAGKGSEFTIRLPLSKVGVAPAPVQSAAPVASQKRHQLRVMLVEDLPDVAEAMQMVLELWGHEVQVASDGPAAIELAPGYAPHVMLLDIGLPGMSGYELAQHLRQLPEFERVVLIALTGYGQASDRERALAAGFDHHLVKGESLDALKRVIAYPRSSPPKD